MGPPPSRMEPTGGSGREAHTPCLLPSPAPLERSPLGPATRPTTRSYGKLGPLWPRASACGFSPARRETEGSGGQLARLSHCGHAVLRALCLRVPRLPPALRGPRRPSWCCPFPGLWAHGGPRPRTNRLFSERPSPSGDRGPCWVLACSAGTARSDLGHEVPLPGSAAHMDPEGTGPASCSSCSAPVLGHGCQELRFPDPRLAGTALHSSGCLHRTRRINPPAGLLSRAFQTRAHRRVASERAPWADDRGGGPGTESGSPPRAPGITRPR